MSETNEIDAGGTAPEILDPQLFRESMSRVVSAVHVVTTGGPAGEAGITATSVCSVTDSPPTVLICINRHSRANEVLKANGSFCLNTLPAGAKALADAFAGRGDMAPVDRFALARWTRLVTGAPVLEDAVAAFDCRIADIREIGTHTVCYGTVLAARSGPAGAATLLYADREYADFRG